ncbi:RDD family protein [Chitinophaga flava]|uniref:RDD domain-containing protein n=1 Tax=Chitinophaga flava TaxID=2259036 RepID=A0A365XS76_9BACT|nr:RDD family protein [Chitinophaga flava]RBL88445.1 hypothetical protein DF182_17805 [Chitinophaga flava]
MESFNDTKNTDLLSDLEEPAPELASKGLRFANYLVDFLVIFVVLICLMNFAQLAMAEIQVIYIVFFLLYYSIMEGLMNGRTIGKMVTGTRVVTRDNEPISFGKALGRSASRLVPFEAFSLLFGDAAWHDNWTNTIVVKNK